MKPYIYVYILYIYVHPRTHTHRTPMDPTRPALSARSPLPDPDGAGGPPRQPRRCGMMQTTSCFTKGHIGMEYKFMQLNLMLPGIT